MLHRLRRHPLPVVAFFEHCLVLTYAVPAVALSAHIPPGLTIDTYRGHGFIAAAFVQTKRLRPAFLPVACGQDFFLAGYRVFVKHRTREGRTLRGLRILRSDADRRVMVCGGNLLTHYNYQHCEAEIRGSSTELDLRVTTPRGEADVDITAHLGSGRNALPSGSLFESEQAARRFAGPMPYTFDYEPETRSIIRIRGIRQTWQPRLVNVDVRTLNFVFRGPLAEHGPALASAFHVSSIDYRWERGVVKPLEAAA